MIMYKKATNLFAPNNNDPEAKYMLKHNNKNRTFIVLRGVFRAQPKVYNEAFMRK